MSMTRNVRRWLQKQNGLYPDALTQIPRERWPIKADVMTDPPIEVWRSKQFLVQVYSPKDGAQLLTICRCRIGDTRLFADGISWDDLQRIKREIGRASEYAVELFPADSDIVNVSNMRHLWLVPAPQFAWRKTL